jgi:hypothetical protein
MKLSSNVVPITIHVNGKNNQSCGTKNNHCRFQIDESECILFNKTLIYENYEWGYLRCKKCLEVFEK